MENFTSIFELLAAFNFALVISNDFLIAVNIKITGYLGKSKMDIENIDNILRVEIKDYIDKALSNKDLNPVLKEGYTSADTTCQQHYDSQKAISERIKFIENKLSFSSNFTAYSLFAGIYCMIILLISGINSQFCSFIPQKTHTILNEFFILFNFFSILIIILSIGIKNKLKKIVVWFKDFSLRNVILVYLYSSILASITTLTC